MKVITALIITLAVGVGATSVYYNDKLNDQKELTDQANAKVQQLKEQDEKLFNSYREVIGLASGMIGCVEDVSTVIENATEVVSCLDDKTAKVNAINDKLDMQLEDRKALVGAEK